MQRNISLQKNWNAVSGLGKTSSSEASLEITRLVNVSSDGNDHFWVMIPCGLCLFFYQIFISVYSFNAA